MNSTPLKPVRRLARHTLTIVVILGLVACAGVVAPVQEQKTPAGVVKDRAELRWKSLIAGDFNQAYTYLAPSYRSVVDAQRYSRQFTGGLQWTAAEVVDVRCATERCTARIKVSYRPIITGRVGEPATNHVDETWVLEDKQWWLFQQL